MDTKPDYMSQAEWDDNVVLKAAILKEKESMYYYMNSASKWDETMLRACGQKTIEGAIVSRFKAAQKHIERLNAAYFKKWPDK